MLGSKPLWTAGLLVAIAAATLACDKRDQSTAPMDHERRTQPTEAPTPNEGRACFDACVRNDIELDHGCYESCVPCTRWAEYHKAAKQPGEFACLDACQLDGVHVDKRCEDNCSKCQQWRDEWLVRQNIESDLDKAWPNSEKPQ